MSDEPTTHDDATPGERRDRRSTADESDERLEDGESDERLEDGESDERLEDGESDERLEADETGTVDKNDTGTVEKYIEGGRDDIELPTAGEDSQAPTPAERHAARAAVYSAAAGALCYPDDELVADLSHDETAAGLRSAAAKLDLTAEVDALLAALDASDRESLESAYNDLFGLPSDDGTYSVVPYEAEYTVGDEVGRQQRRIATVVGLLEAFGVEPADEFAERQDHVVVELELMQVLSARRAVACEQGEADTADNLERAEAMVLDEHLGDFAPAFAHEVRRSTADPDEDAADEEGTAEGNDATAVYRAAADLAEAVVTRDLARHPEPDVDAEPSTGVGSRA